MILFTSSSKGLVALLMLITSSRVSMAPWMLGSSFAI